MPDYAIDWITPLGSAYADAAITILSGWMRCHCRLLMSLLLTFAITPCLFIFAAIFWLRHWHVIDTPLMSRTPRLPLTDLRWCLRRCLADWCWPPIDADAADYADYCWFSWLRHATLMLIDFLRWCLSPSIADAGHDAIDCLMPFQDGCRLLDADAFAIRLISFSSRHAFLITPPPLTCRQLITPFRHYGHWHVISLDAIIIFTPFAAAAIISFRCLMLTPCEANISADAFADISFFWLLMPSGANIYLRHCR